MAQPAWGATRHTHHRVLITHHHPLRLRIADSRTGLSCFVFHCFRARTGLYATCTLACEQVAFLAVPGVLCLLQWRTWGPGRRRGPRPWRGETEREDGHGPVLTAYGVRGRRAAWVGGKQGCALIPNVRVGHDVCATQKMFSQTTTRRPRSVPTRSQVVRGAAARVCRAPTPPVRVHASWGGRTRCRRGRIMNL